VNAGANSRQNYIKSWASNLLLSVDYRTLAEFLGYKIAPHHTKIFDHYLTHKKTLDLAPRGCGKSTVGAVLYPLHRLLQNPDLRILIVSDTASMAEGFLSEIKQHLESERWIEKFGDWRGSKWTDSEIKIATRRKISKEPNIQALGARGSVTSRHVDIIIADDLVDFENARTETQRVKLKNWFKTTLVPVLEPWGEIHINGTRYHPYDLYHDLIRSGEYHVQMQRALENNQSIWEEKWSVEDLLKLKEELGSIIFNMQYQNDVELAKEGNIFKYEWLRFYNSEEVPKDLKVYMGIDLAISQKETADYFTICTIGVDLENNVYVLDVYRGRHTFTQQVNIIEAKEKEWKPIRIGVESNQYQRAMAEVLKKKWLPVKELVTTKDKVTRAQIRSAIFESGKVFIRRSMHEFIDEIVLFPDAKHDDQFDAFDFACEVAISSLPDETEWDFF